MSYKKRKLEEPHKLSELYTASDPSDHDTESELDDDMGDGDSNSIGVEISDGDYNLVFENDVEVCGNVVRTTQLRQLRTSSSSSGNKVMCPMLFEAERHKYWSLPRRMPPMIHIHFMSNIFMCTTHQ